MTISIQASARPSPPPTSSRSFPTSRRGRTRPCSGNTSRPASRPQPAGTLRAWSKPTASGAAELLTDFQYEL